MSDLFDHTILVDGKKHLRDAKGRLIPIEAVKPHKRLEDELVRDLIHRARELARLITAFKTAGFSEVDAFNDLLDEKYGVTGAGEKGNQTLATFDGLMNVHVAVADRIEFGPELQQAKALIDECLNQWSAGSGFELRTIITKAFDVDKQGRINAKALLALKSHAITDPRWVRAMAAIDDSIQIIGSKRYIRFRVKDKLDGVWSSIALDIAVA